MAKKQTMTPAEYRASQGTSTYSLKKSTPAKMEPMKDPSLEGRVKQLERELKALWNAHTLLQTDLNKLSGKQ